MVEVLADFALQHELFARPPITLPTDAYLLPGHLDSQLLTLGLLLDPLHEGVDLNEELAGSEVRMVLLQHRDEGIEVVWEGLGLSDGEVADV